MAQKILIVDDELELRELVKTYLTGEGFQVVTARDGREALFVARYEKPDLVLLDIMMPEMGGYDFVRVYSREADTPIIMVTAKLTENDKVLGLELGADDYITKPFGMRELTARVRAVLRRVSKAGQPEQAILRVADIELDRNGRYVTVANQPVELTPTEFELLAALMATPGRTYSRLDLLDQLQGDAFVGSTRNIDAHIRRLRTKIEPDPANPRYVETVYGMGYRFAKES
ncbi:MAG: response regulator transcription factor [Chloroflexota bacterium]